MNWLFVVVDVVGGVAKEGYFSCHSEGVSLLSSNAAIYLSMDNESWTKTTGEARFSRSL